MKPVLYCPGCGTYTFSNGEKHFLDFWDETDEVLDAIIDTELEETVTEEKCCGG